MWSHGTLILEMTVTTERSVEILKEDFRCFHFMKDGM